MTAFPSINDCPAVQFRIARPTGNLKKIEDFYVQGLGLRKLDTFEDHQGYSGLMIGLPDSRHHLEFTQHATAPSCPAPTRDNLLVLYFDAAGKLETVKRRLENMGIREVAPENPYWKGRGYTYEDPDGWRVVLFNGIYEEG